MKAWAGTPPRNPYPNWARKKVKHPLLTPSDPNSVLLKHKRFLKQLEDKKNIEREEKVLNQID